MNARIAVPTSVKIINGALDETSDGEIILRGVVAPESLASLQVDDYQREVLPLTAMTSILDALKGGEVLPDIELGMRGQRYTEKDGVFVLRDSVFIVDGQQRVNGGLHTLQTDPDTKVRIGATIHFGTNKDWERERFRILNTLRNKVSPNVILRNKREESPLVEMLFNLCANDKSFALHNRVSWSQRMTRSEILTALTLAKTVGWLHSHKAPTKRNDIEELVPALDKAMDIFGIQNLRSNMRTFFDLIDECWGIKRVQYKEGAPHIKGTFLSVIARLLSNHTDFWRQPDEKQLVIEASLRRKIAQFPVHDPSVANLASSGGKSRELLYMMLRDHINSGKRTKRLKSRVGDMISIESSDDEDSETSAS